MSIRRLTLALSLAFSVPALGQPATIPSALVCANNRGNQINCATSRPTTGDRDLDRAVGICDLHRRATNQQFLVFNPNSDQTIYEFLEGYQACNAVMARYDQTAAAKAERERAAKEEADRAFVDQFVRNLK